MFKNKKYIGMNGQIASITNSHIDIVCADGLLRISDYENVDKVELFVGHKLR